MRLINVETLKLEEFFGTLIPSYAILSHTWGADEEEISFNDIERQGAIGKTGKWRTKLEGCCKQTKKDNLRFVWIDTCCINKDSSAELSEAINSMFQWYKKATVCYVYLQDVPAADRPEDPGSKFRSSRWFRRGWTLQELLAPRALRFFGQTWDSIGTGMELSGTIENITGIPQPFLLGLVELDEASVAQRMSWAGKRTTKRDEDMAYCLLGIFGVVLPMIYGEGGDRAFNRLQQEIMKNNNDDSILAWHLSPEESISSETSRIAPTGALASAPSDFTNCGLLVLRNQYTRPINSFEIAGGCVQLRLPLYTTSAGKTYGLLNCGPEYDRERVVGIPLETSKSDSASWYIRPQGRHSILLNRSLTSIPLTIVHIKIRPSMVTNRRNWFYITKTIETNMDLVEVYPGDRWQKKSHMITTPKDSEKNTVQRSFARFRSINERSRDVIVVLEYEVQQSQTQARCHVMTYSRDTALDDLSHKFALLRPEALGERQANSGTRNVEVTMSKEEVLMQPMFAVKLATTRYPPITTIDANLELLHLDMKLGFVGLLFDREKTRLEAERLERRRREKVATLKSMTEQLAETEQALRILLESKKSLVEGLETETEEMKSIIDRQNEIIQDEEQLPKRGLDMHRSIHGFFKDMMNTSVVDRAWFEAFFKSLLDTGKISTDFTDVKGQNCDVTPFLWIEGARRTASSQTPLSWAVRMGHTIVLKQLLDDGVELEAKDPDGWTPLALAALNGHRAIVGVLLDHGANPETKCKSGRTPLAHAAEAGHEAVVELLLAAGVNQEARSFKGNTPLALAAKKGHEDVVKLLLAWGVNAEPRGTSGKTPLTYAAQGGHEAVLKLLLQEGCVFDSTDNQGRTPLKYAAQNGHDAVVKALLEKYIDA